MNFDMPNTSLDGVLMAYIMAENGGFISNCFVWSTNEVFTCSETHTCMHTYTRTHCKKFNR